MAARNETPGAGAPIRIGRATALGRDNLGQERANLLGDRFRMGIQRPVIAFGIEKRTQLRLAEPKKMRDGSPVALFAVNRPANLAGPVLGEA